MASHDLQDRLQAIPGVASAEVTLHDDQAPVARVYLDGSRDEREVRERVDALLGSSVPKTTVPAPRKRGGLGRGLDDLLNEEPPDVAPAHINGTQPRPVVHKLSKVGVVETADGVVVELAGEDGFVEQVPVGTDGSIDAAVIVGMRRILGIPESTYITVRNVDSGQGTMVVAAVTTDTGVRLAGAAFVEFGRPWAAANAVLNAVTQA